MKRKSAYVIALPDRKQAIETMQDKQFELLALMDYIAGHHPGAVTPHFIRTTVEEVESIALKYGIRA